MKLTLTLRRLWSLLTSQASLDKMQTMATIFSLIAIPIIVASLGFRIQSDISKESLKKEYVDIAIRILAEPVENSKNKDLRKWAVDVLSKYSPVPFTSELKESWLGAAINVFPLPSNSFRQRAISSELLEPPLKMLEPYDENIRENIEISRKNTEKLLKLQEELKSQSIDNVKFFRE